MKREGLQQVEPEARWVRIKLQIARAFIPDVFDVRWNTFPKAWMTVQGHCQNESDRRFPKEDMQHPMILFYARRVE